MGGTVGADAEDRGLVGAVRVHKFRHHVAAAGSIDDADVAAVDGGCRNGEVASGAVRAVAEPEELATLHRVGVLDRRPCGAEDEASRRLDGGDEEVVGSGGEEAPAYVHGRSKRRGVEAELDVGVLASHRGRELPGTPVQQHPRVVRRRFLHFRRGRKGEREEEEACGWLGFSGWKRVGLGRVAEAGNGDGGVGGLRLAFACASCAVCFDCKRRICPAATVSGIGGGFAPSTY